MKKILLCMLVILSVSVLNAQEVIHTIERGETLESIAKKYHVSVYALKKANPDLEDIIYVGMKLKIPKGSKSKGVIETPEKQTIAPSTDNNSLVNQRASNNTNDIKKSDDSFGLLKGQDFTFVLDPDNKVYGLRMNQNGFYDWLGISFGLTQAFVSHGSFEGFMGIGLSPVCGVGPVLLGLHLYPYVNIYSVYEQDGEYRNGTPKFDNKIKFGYGAKMDLMAGIKVFTTKKGKDIYLIGSYHVSAFEFKTEGAFKNGLWGIGIRISLDD